MSEAARYTEIVHEATSNEETAEALTSFDTGKDDLKSFTESGEILLTESQRDFLEGYLDNLESLQPWTEKIRAEEESGAKQETVREINQILNRLENDIQRAVDEDRTLEQIAATLRDGRLTEEAEKIMAGLERPEARLQRLAEKKSQTEEMLQKFESVRERIGGDHSMDSALKHRKAAVEAVLENSETGRVREDGPVKIHMTEELIEELVDAAENYVEEISGILICRRRGRDWTVLKVLRTGVGTEGSVSPDTARLSAANELTEKYSKYSLVEFHTHSAGTIARHGEEFADGWSKQDIENFKDQEKGYVGMLVTPKKILTRSKGDFEVETNRIKKGKRVNEWNNDLKEEFSDIKSGHSFSKLPELTPFSKK